VDSNHRPPGPEPENTLFCRALQVLADPPYIPVFALFSTTCRAFRLAPVCTALRLLVARKGREKGKVSQVIDSRFTHHCRPPASRCGRTDRLRMPAGTGDPKHPARPHRSRKQGNRPSRFRLSSPPSEHAITRTRNRASLIEASNVPLLVLLDSCPVIVVCAKRK